MRGIDWVAVPTTLVGQVDAAIGGKTAIDLPEAKNLVGAFHWPVRTVIDPALLATLPEDERLNGMAEVVKTGLLAGEPLWELPDEELVRALRRLQVRALPPRPARPRARGTRSISATPSAHALEAASGYALPHGRAVALGLLAALRLSGPGHDAGRGGAPPASRCGSTATARGRRCSATRRGKLRIVLLRRRATSCPRPTSARRSTR